MDHRFVKIVWILCIGIIFNGFTILVYASDADEYYARGLKAYLAGDFKQANSELEQAFKIDSRHDPSMQLQKTIDHTRQQTQSNQGLLSQLTSALESEQEQTQALKSLLLATEQRLTTLNDESRSYRERVEQRDEQLTKLRGVYDALDRQYIEIEAQRNQLEGQVTKANEERLNFKEKIARLNHDIMIDKQESQQSFAIVSQETNQLYRKLQTVEENLNQLRLESITLKDERDDLIEQLSTTQERLTKDQQVLAEMKSQLRLESELTVGRERKFNTELDTLRNVQLQLEERLSSSRDHNAKLEESMTDLQGSSIHMQDMLHDRDAQLRVANSQNKVLQRSIEQQQDDLTRLQHTTDNSRQNEKNLRQQLKIAKDSLDTLQEQVRQLTVAKAERDDLQGELSVRETETSKLGQQVHSLQRELDMTKRKLQLGDETNQQASRSAEIEQRGLELHVESLERELRELRGFESKLRAELKARPPVGGANKAFVDQLVNKLAEREAQLKQAESVIKLLQGSPGGLVPRREAFNSTNDLSLMNESRIIGSEALRDKRPSSVAGNDLTAGLDDYSSDAHPVKVYQINDELDFVVFSMEDESSWAKTGATLLLVLGDQPIAKVRLTELDSAGFAVAQITQTLSRSRQIQKGDLLLARPLLSPVGQ